MRLILKDNSLRWKLLLAVLFGLFLAGMAASMVMAARRMSRVVDADYYSHGLHYGRTGNGSPNAGLGWTMTASLSGGDLRVRVSDRSGAPVAGGALRLVPEPGRAGLGRPLQLAESASGSYCATRPISPRGELHGTLHFTRGDCFASRKLVLFN